MNIHASVVCVRETSGDLVLAIVTRVFAARVMKTAKRRKNSKAVIDK